MCKINTNWQLAQTIRQIIQHLPLRNSTNRNKRGCFLFFVRKTLKVSRIDSIFVGIYTIEKNSQLTEQYEDRH